MSVIPVALRNFGEERTAQLVCIVFACLQLLASDRCEKKLQEDSRSVRACFYLHENYHLVHSDYRAEPYAP